MRVQVYNALKKWCHGSANGIGGIRATHPNVLHMRRFRNDCGGTPINHRQAIETSLDGYLHISKRGLVMDVNAAY